MSEPIPLNIGIVGENGLAFLLPALLLMIMNEELLKPCRCRKTTFRGVSRPGHRREGLAPQRTVDFGVTGRSQSLRSTAGLSQCRSLGPIRLAAEWAAGFRDKHYAAECRL